MEALLAGVQVLFTDPLVFVGMVFGIFMGIIFGAVPGLTTILAVTLMIPFTFAMSPTVGLAILIGIFAGGISGGLITATLINIPGTPASLTTCWDGYPMSKKGKPAEALSLGVFSSLVGGVVSAIAIFLIAPQLARIALLMGSWELFAICLMGLCIVSSLSGNDVVKGLMGASIGLLLGAVGIDSIIGVSRLTFGFWQLTGGMSMAAIMAGFFAVREICDQINDLGKPRLKMDVKRISLMPPWKEMKDCAGAFIWGNLAGILIGILPGIGQTPACVLAYNQAKRTSKYPERFGTGTPEGVVVSETANTATSGGALIPLITLGIPGDGVTAALIGGFMIHGLQPGPFLFTQNPEIVGTIMVAWFLASFILYFMLLGLMRVFIKMVNVKLSFLFPAIIIFCLLGIFAINHRIFDIWIMIIFGIVGFFMKQLKVDMIALLLGFILGPMIESNFRRALVASDGDLSAIFQRPWAVIFLCIALLFLFWPSIKKLYTSIVKNPAGA